MPRAMGGGSICRVGDGGEDRRRCEIADLDFAILRNNGIAT